MIPFPTQLSGAKFLADRKAALLADEPRVGKTGTAVIAADYNLAEKILIVTTASGRHVWRKGFKDWTAFDRPVQILQGRSDKLNPKIPVTIVGWPSVGEPQIRHELLKRDWDLCILDESHFAKNYEAKRTRGVYGEFLEGGKIRVAKSAIVDKAAATWCLTGTPIPNAPNDLWAMLRALAPERLNGFIEYEDFLHHFCQVRMKRISNFRSVPVVMGGKNLDELKAMLDGFVLRRTQQDVGIREPIYDTYPLAVSEAQRRSSEKDLDKAAIIKAAEDGNTKDLEMHLGPLRRITGELKAHAAVAALKEEFECGLDKVVLMAWHKDAMQILREGLSSYGVVSIDGATLPAKRNEAEERFRNDPNIRVFVGQIQAAGEAIDLSAAATLYFVETSTVPKDMKQASLRVTNHTQKRQVLVRVCVLEGSIDEAIETILLRKWSTIREVLS